jgi:hypothetical protein
MQKIPSKTNDKAEKIISDHHHEVVNRKIKAENRVKMPAHFKQD